MKQSNRNGWAGFDVTLSDRHRLYGSDIAACDLDFILIEYAYGKAAALVEYKRLKNLRSASLNSTSISALFSINDKLPTYVIAYSDRFDFYFLKRNAAGGQALEQFLASRNQKIEYKPVVFADEDEKFSGIKAPCLSESDYIRFLHHIRGCKLSASAIKFIKSIEQKGFL